MSEARLSPLGPSAMSGTGSRRWNLAGVLSFETVTRLVAEGDALFQDLARRPGPDHRALEIDLSGVEAANSAGLALLLEWTEMARARGIRLTYRHLPGSLLRIAAFSNVHTILPVAADIA